MKKTLTINLNSIVFHIDDDAYELLQSYLSEVSHHFKSDNERTDIMNDIEARIAELFNERMEKLKNVITIDDVDAVITTMGKPNQFSDDEPKGEHQAETHNEKEDQARKLKSKKYYRDIDNRLLSGLASGLAVYLNWDVTLVRIIFVVLAFVTSGTFILIYLFMWIIVPKAITTAQKLEMQGESVNIETIRNKMLDTKEYLDSDKFKQAATSTGNRIMDVVRILFKIVLTLVGVVVSIIGVILIATLIFGLIIFLLEPASITSIHPDFFIAFGGTSPDKIILLIISLLLIIGCPIFALIYWSLNTISKERKKKSHTALWISLILWLTGIFMFLGTGTGSYKKLKENGFIFHDNNISWDSSNFISENRTVADFTSIHASGAFKLELTQQAEQTLSVRTLGEYLPHIKTEVTDGVLRIFSTDNLIRPTVIIKIGVDSIENIHAGGASSLEFKNAFNVNKLNINLQGASRSDLNINSAQKLTLTLLGASKLEAEGVTDTLHIVAKGASRIDTDDLNAKVVKVELSGASKANVYASKEFEGKAYGASGIRCSGNPNKRSDSNDLPSSIKYVNNGTHENSALSLIVELPNNILVSSRHQSVDKQHQSDTQTTGFLETSINLFVNEKKNVFYYGISRVLHFSLFLSERFQHGYRDNNRE